MGFYRSKSGDLCEAVQFKGRDDNELCLHEPADDADSPTWVCEALNANTIELSAFGRALIVHGRGGSVGIAVGDWLIRMSGGEITSCRGDRFAGEYEAVGG